MNASEMKDQMNEVLIKMSQVMAKQKEFQQECCSKAEFDSTDVDEDKSMNNTSTGVKLGTELLKCNYYGINQQKP